MTASLLDGKRVADRLKSELKQKVETLLQEGYRRPGLAVILVGKDEASHIYVQNKRLACEAVGFLSFAYDCPESMTQEALLSLIDRLNHDPEVDGILVQLPLPKQIETLAVIEAIFPSKDVDGFHPYHFGRLARGNPTLRPCTPYGIIRLLSEYNLPLVGQDVVVIGASPIVGRPMAFEFLLAGSTVTLCHRKTQQLESKVRAATILVIAAGQQGLVRLEWLNQNQIAIDVGIHRDEKHHVSGDLPPGAAERVAWITPVPGGVGPMTVAMLLENTWTTYHQAIG